MLRNLLLLTIAIASAPLTKASSNTDFEVKGIITYINFDHKSMAELTVGASYQINPNVALRSISSVLVNSSYANKPMLNLGLVDIHTVDEAYGVRIGRVEHIQGFNTSQYNWPEARDMYVQPQGVYRESLRYFQRSGDGLQVYSRQKIGTSSLDIDVTYAKPVRYPMNDTVKPYNGLYGIGNFTDASRILGTSFKLEIPSIYTVIRYDRQDMKFKLRDSFMNLYDGNLQVVSHYFGVRHYLTDEIELTGEVDEFRLPRTSSWVQMHQIFSAVYGRELAPARPKAYGFNVGWQATPEIKIVAGTSRYYGHQDDPKGKWLPIYGVPKVETYTEDNHVSIKYRKNEWITILEYHKLKGSSTMPYWYTKRHGENSSFIVLSISRVF